MERGEAIAKLKQHETELKRLGVDHLYLLARPREARRATILMLTSFLTIPRGLSGFST